jgi:quercetin dioxygenase-like cupin family protein
VYYKKNDGGYKKALEGVDFKTLAHGKNTHLCEFRLAESSTIPMHKHPQEQIGYMVSGRMKFTIGEETFMAEPGDSWNIPSNVEHGVEILQNSVVIEVFSPLREDYMP